MILLYEGTDMTKYTVISGCEYHDCAGKPDTMTVEAENAADWHRWEPKTDDIVEATEGTWTTGKMYLKKITPSDGRFVLEISSLPSAAERKSWASYAGQTLAGIAAKCAGECGIAWQLWGVDGSYQYPYLIRKECGPSRFLEEMAEREGAMLKCCGQGMRLIGVEKAGKRAPVCSLILNASQDGLTYKKDETVCWGELTVVSGNISKTVKDLSISQGRTMSMSLPAGNDLNAARWAKNLLMMNNLKKEKITINIGINLNIGAMSCVNVTGGTEMDGTWMVTEAEHDLIERQSRVTMIRTVG